MELLFLISRIGELSMDDDLDIQRIWTAQLYNEHEDISWRYGLRLPTPVIEIVKVTSFWGKWCPDFGSGTIKISFDLINEFSWDLVINLLKHEIAHQIVAQIFKSNDGHGEIFKKACSMIGLSGHFAGSQGDLPEIMEEIKKNGTDQEKAKIIDKVKKLLSLAQSENEHEAALAMEKAKLIINKYNLERIGQNEISPYTYKIINHKKKRIEKYQRHICSILQNYFFVKIVYSYLYEAHSNETHRTIEILGTKENVEMGEYVYFFLLNQLKLLWNSYRSKTMAPGMKKTSYWLGVLSGFNQKLKLIDKKNNSCTNSIGDIMSALVRSDDKMLLDFEEKRFPKLGKYKSKSSIIYAKTYAAGIDDGKKLNLYKGLSKRSGYQGKLLIKR